MGSLNKIFNMLKFAFVVCCAALAAGEPQNWDGALDDVNRLKEMIDADHYSQPNQLLQQRTWLIHWSLFVFFNHVKGRDLLIDMFLYQPAYLNAIQTTCPHILRYLTTAVITNKRRKKILKDLVRVIQ